MEPRAVLMACPMSAYLEQELEKRFELLRFWAYPQRRSFLRDRAASVAAVVGGADSELIEALPNLEIVASYGVGLERVDLGKCRERGVRVTNTPDVVAEDVADLVIGLILAVLRRICACDRFVRSEKWKKAGYI